MYVNDRTTERLYFGDQARGRCARDRVWAASQSPHTHGLRSRRTPFLPPSRPNRYMTFEFVHYKLKLIPGDPRSSEVIVLIQIDVENGVQVHKGPLVHGL